jgi:hypothetical protein
MAENAIIPLIDNLYAPDFFAIAASGFFHLVGSTIIITLEGVRPDHTADNCPPARIVVGRLILSIGGAQGLAIGLNDFLEKQGLGPSAAVTGAATKQ